MKASVDWGPTKSFFDSKSPPIKLSGVPAGTTRLDIRMSDLDAPDYFHGGGKVDYSGAAALPYGAFSDKGPYPPNRHKYKFTIRALDASGKALATTNATKSFQRGALSAWLKAGLFPSIARADPAWPRHHRSF